MSDAAMNSHISGRDGTTTAEDSQHGDQRVASRCQDFRDFTHHPKNKRIGINGNDELVPYVTTPMLRNYWDVLQIRFFLEAFGIETETAIYIYDNCLQIFSILCYIGSLRHVNDFVAIFQDIHLPVKVIPVQWEDKPELRAAYDKFSTAQWRFTPYVFDSSKTSAWIRFPKEKILPIVPAHQPDDDSVSGDSKVYKVMIDKDCHTLPDSRVVFKEFSEEGFQTWENEVNTYVRIMEHSHNLESGPAKYVSVFDYIAHYFCSFVHLSETTAGKRIIVLQDIQKGTLLDYVINNEPTLRESETACRALWQQLFYHLLQGLHAIHHLSSETTCCVVHGDLKEKNILYTGTNITDTKTPCFKIIDLGQSHISTKRGTQRLNWYDNFGNKLTRAPEASDTLPVHAALPGRNPTSAMDIWAMGCIFSNILIGCRFGRKGMEDYFAERTKENAARKDLSNGGYGPGFHNGIGRLEAIDNRHKQVIQSAPADSVIHIVSRMILDHMLQVDPSRRKGADELARQFSQELEALVAGTQDAIKPSGQGNGFAHGPRSNVTPAPSENHNLQEERTPGIQTTSNSTTASQTPGQQQEYTSGEQIPAPTTVQDIVNSLSLSKHISKDRHRDVWTAVEELKSQNGREQFIILVDNGPRRSDNQDTLCNVARTATKFLKHAVTHNGIHLSFASDRDGLAKIKTSSKMVKAITRHGATATSQALAERFRQIARTSVIPLLGGKHPVASNIIILTDRDLPNGGNNNDILFRAIQEILEALRDKLPNLVCVTIIRCEDDAEEQAEGLRMLETRVRDLVTNTPYKILTVLPHTASLAMMLTQRIRQDNITITPEHVVSSTPFHSG